MPDYGNGKTNIDTTTGIRYGVIHPNDVSADWLARFEAIYASPDNVECPACEHDCTEPEQKWGDSLQCEECGHNFAIEMSDCLEPIRFVWKGEGVEAEYTPERDIFVTKSNWVTQAPFCSPCAPGACSLMRATTYGEHGGELCYCLPPGCFDDDRAPYRVFDAKTLEEVFE